MSHPNARIRDLGRILPLLASSMLAGDNVDVHCVSGLCRSRLGAAIIIAAVEGINLREAMARVERLRGVAMSKAKDSMLGNDWTVLEIKKQLELFTPYHSYANFMDESYPSTHAEVGEGRTIRTLCGQARYARESSAAVTIYECLHVARRECSSFCSYCQDKMVASAQLEVQKVYGA